MDYTLIEKFIEWTQSNGWNYELSDEEQVLSEEVIARYKNIPEQWLRFISKFTYIANSEENLWFLTCNNYTDFCYDFENMSLDAASGDEEWTEDIKNFWDKTFPIVMSVGGDYYYYGINIETGKIVSAYEPEFEETVDVTDSFEIFIRKVISGEILLVV